MWEESLQLTVEAQPTHVSVYDLPVEEGTKFGILYTPGEFPLPSETQLAKFYRVASRTLSNAGYSHYEISSYYKNKPFYGFGLGSASYLGGVRFSRPKKLKEYAGYVQNLEDRTVESHGDSCADAKDMAMNAVMLSFRTARGLDLKSFKETFGSSLVHSLCKAYRPYVESGHVVCLDKKMRTVTTYQFHSLLPDEEREMGLANGLYLCLTSKAQIH